MRNVVKVRIYPTTEQQAALSKAFGCARWWWNHALNLNNETYKATGKGLSRQGYNDRLPELKKEFPWLAECYSQVQAISDCGWSEFTRQLKYKAEKDGKTYLEIGRFFPSSKTCHVCLNQVDSLSLDVRRWECANCKTKHDRDVNAAINIRDEGLRLLSLGTSDTAQGGNVRPKRGRKSSVEAVAVELGSPVPLRAG